MKKQLLWVSILSLFLLLAACTAKPEATEPTEFRVACFGCEELFVSGQLNADFGLCQDCMLRVGAAYCQDCEKPCYTRDMVHGLCQTCSAAVEETTAQQETTAATTTVQCEYCGKTVLSEYMVGGYCLSCNCIRNGKCLKCTYNAHLEGSGYCGKCSATKFFCANCQKLTDGNEMYMDLCKACYGKDHSLLVSCPLCGKDIAPEEIKGGYCSSCRAQADYHEDERNFAKCDVCGVTYGYSDPLVCGICQACWGEGYGPVGVCRMCGKAYGEEGFEGICFSCQDKYGPKCSSCGTDLTYQGGVDGMCYACYEAANSCKGCGSQTYKDGYCYYCHPDFTWYCVKCGSQNPDYGPADKICNYCKCDRCDAVLTTPGGINGLCDDCYDAPEICPSCNVYTVYKDGLCYWCQPDTEFICSNCGESKLCPVPNSNICYDCDGQG